MSESATTAIVLAAGQGTRMNSPLPKVLHPVAGVPMIQKVIRSLQNAGVSEVRVVLGYGEKLVRQTIEPMGVRCFVQKNQFGTADAVRAAEPGTIEGDVVITNGDHPLLTSDHLKDFMRQHKLNRTPLSVVTAVMKNPGDLGRIVRNQGSIRSIVEVKDASQETLKINEINSGIYFASAKALNEVLPKVQNHNAKEEFYLTDIVPLSVENGQRVGAIQAPPAAAFGVNTQAELAKATRICYARKTKELLKQGVLVVDPAQTYIDDKVKIGPSSVIYPGVYIRGNTQIGSFCVVEPNCFISHSVLGDSVQVRGFSYLEHCVVHTKATLGPYARLRPESEVGEEAKVGNFVELKKAKLGARSKASHLTYLGDAEIGEDSNIGCGTITCNYAVDGKKYVTQIGDKVFVGSDTQFVAPIKVGDNSYIGSGTTVTKDIPPGSLAVARSKLVIKHNYQPKRKPDSTETATPATERPS